MSIQNHFQAIALKTFDEDFAKVHLKPSFQTPELFITVIVSTMVGIALYWIDSLEHKTPESLAIDLITIIINGSARAGGLIQDNFIDVEAIINQ